MIVEIAIPLPSLSVYFTLKIVALCCTWRVTVFKNDTQKSGDNLPLFKYSVYGLKIKHSIDGGCELV